MCFEVNIHRLLKSQLSSISSSFSSFCSIANLEQDIEILNEFIHKLNADNSVRTVMWNGDVRKFRIRTRGVKKTHIRRVTIKTVYVYTLSVKFLLKYLEFFNKDTGGIMAKLCKTLFF
jgi:hypothetical protein